MARNLTPESLYETRPDKLYVSKEFDAWYAFYEIELCILTNADGDLAAYCYDEKSDYRDARRFILTEYNVKEEILHSYED